jgi:ribonuclease VapC
LTADHLEVVVDASAVLAWVFDEDGADSVEHVFSRAGISAVNFAEVLHIGSVRQYPPDLLEADLAAFGLGLLPFTGNEARRTLEVKAAEDRAHVRLSSADRACLATGLSLGRPVVASDPAWKSLGLAVDIRQFR